MKFGNEEFIEQTTQLDFNGMCTNGSIRTAANAIDLRNQRKTINES